MLWPSVSLLKVGLQRPPLRHPSVGPLAQLLRSGQAASPSANSPAYNPFTITRNPSNHVALPPPVPGAPMSRSHESAHPLPAQAEDSHNVGVG